MKKTFKKIIGDRGEEYVANYIRKKGFIISARNYRSRFGEIDIVAENNELILFVEVKTRSENSYAFINAKDSVTYSKQQRIIATAEYYILNNGIELQPRFDVAEVITKGSGDFSKVTLNYIENAFGGF